MSANVPEKIHIQPNAHDRWFEGNIPNGLPNGLFVEYVRADAFIDKACAWLKENVTNNPECNRIISKKGVITMGELIEDFRNYMKEE